MSGPGFSHSKGTKCRSAQPILVATTEIVTPLRQTCFEKGGQPVIEILLPLMMAVHDTETCNTLTGAPLENGLHGPVCIVRAAQLHARHGQGFQADVPQPVGAH